MPNGKGQLDMDMTFANAPACTTEAAAAKAKPTNKFAKSDLPGGNGTIMVLEPAPGTAPGRRAKLITRRYDAARDVGTTRESCHV